MSRRDQPDADQSILFVIPHYYGEPATATVHGSSAHARLERSAVVRNTIESLHGLFGPSQGIMQLAEGRTKAANVNLRSRLEVEVCCLPEHHLLEQPGLNRGLFRLHEESVIPKHLGFAAHRRLLERIDEFDWFVYLEDDLLIHDPLWFTKLDWFATNAGADALLMPNRFERSSNSQISKAYVDGDLRVETAGAFQDPSISNEVCLSAIGSDFRFVRPLNPHSGCFALRRDQLRRLAQTNAFGKPCADFIGPLESAATLAVMSNFRVYKPAVENAAFLEVEHQSQQFIRQLRSPSQRG